MFWCVELGGVVVGGDLFWFDCGGDDVCFDEF